MSDLIKISRQYKEKADLLLKKTGLIKDLKKFGAVYFSGAYAHDLMMHGDIDIKVVKKSDYSPEEVFKIFKHLHFSNKFISGFIGGDWDNPKLGKEFPNGRYIGLKQKIDGETWKCDIWFISQKEFERLEDKDFLIDKVLTNKQKELILSCKKYRNDSRLKISSQIIYGLVLSGKCKNIADFKKYVKTL